MIGNKYELVDKRIDNIEDMKLNYLYEGRNKYENIPVLIKVVEHNKKIKEHFMSNLIDEVTTLRNINSEYIAKLIDVGIHFTENKKLYYIAYEYNVGIELNKMIIGNYLHLEGIINILTQVLKALKLANEFGIYHGDLNTFNIMVDKSYNIKVYDFGVTKANHGVNIRSSEINYLSPHQLTVDYTDLESDFFSLGVILFECIFKKMPFEIRDNEEDMIKEINKGIQWNNIKAINGNDELIEVVKKLLKRTDKYKTIDEILIDVSNVMYKKVDIIENDVEENLNNKKIKLKSNIKPKFLLTCTAVIVVAVMILSVI